MDITRLAVCGHEIGHMSMIYWRKESLHRYKAVVNGLNGFVITDGSFLRRPGCYDLTDLMLLIAGPLVQYLMHGLTPQRAIRCGGEYKDPQSDSSRTREIVRQLCNGVDSRKFQFAVQEQTRSIVQEPAMWAAITEAAEKLYQAGSITGEEVEASFDAHSHQRCSTHERKANADDPECSAPGRNYGDNFRKGEKTMNDQRVFIEVVPTPGSSFERDMEERDAAVEHCKRLIAAGAETVVTLHYDLDDRHIEMAVARWRSVPAKLYLVDGSESQQRWFLRRWEKCGGPKVIVGKPPMEG